MFGWSMNVMIQTIEFCRGTTLYQEFMAERAEIDRHKWLESEKQGRDVGFDWALTDWVCRYRKGWLRSRASLRQP